MDEDPTAKAMTVVAEELIRAYCQTDWPAVEKALDAEIIRSVQALHPAMGNIHLAFAFARILARECPETARDGHGVPQLLSLIGDGAERPGDVDARLSLSMDLGQPVTTADAKASIARYAEGIPLAQKFMRTWVRTPQFVPGFVETHAAASPVMTDAVWGVLWQACVAARRLPGTS
ncbi:hypothetical protein [Nonomuraea jabiensis]|uniref:hypothetical protein n=1 Tax=Nonomuraea jabiensis TaxID=882448 RepID=UPI003D733EC0